MVAKDLLLVSFICLVVQTGQGSILGDECDWTGSGLSSIPHTITPIYLRCPTGNIRWLYPMGALRVLLRLPSGKDFRACIKSTHQGPQPSPRLYLEAPRSLVPLQANGDGPTPCFMSRGGQVALYVEASGDVAKKKIMGIEYDLEVVSKGYDPNEECRPCTGEELAHAFCTSDLVTRGIIAAVENDYTRDISELRIHTTKLIRHATDDGYTNDIDNEIEDIPEETNEISVKVARHCGVNHGTGEFVFMARRKLGELTLRCAPRIEDWKHLVHSLTEEGKTHCVLRS